MLRSVSLQSLVLQVKEGRCIDTPRMPSVPDMQQLHVRHGGFFSVYSSSMKSREAIVFPEEQLCGGDMSYEYVNTLKRIGVIAVAAAVSGVALADADLDQKIADPANWAAAAGDYSNHRYSSLKQITASNVGKLQVAWTMSTGVLRGHEGSPLVIGDTMYMHTPFPNNVYAVNLKDQTFKWKYEPKQDTAVIPVMCCDTVNRGLAYGDGKIFLQQADTTLVALDAQTGKVVWTAKNGDAKIGETNTNAPHVFKDKVLTGISGGEFGVRGRVVAYDIKTGKQVWKGYSTGPDAEMLIDPAKTMTWTNGKMAPVGKDSSLKSEEH